jgi:hypothetical protein
VGGSIADDLFNDPTGYATSNGFNFDEIFNYGELRMSSKLTLKKPTIIMGLLYLAEAMASPGISLTAGTLTLAGGARQRPARFGTSARSTGRRRRRSTARPRSRQRLRHPAAADDRPGGAEHRRTGSKFLANYTIDNGGTINWAAPRAPARSLRHQDVTINNPVGSTFNLLSDADLSASVYYSAPRPTINNGGTFRKSGAGESVFSNLQLNKLRHRRGRRRHVHASSTTIDTAAGTFPHHRHRRGRPRDLHETVGHVHGHNYHLSRGTLESTFTITGTLNWTAAQNDTTSLSSTPTGPATC